MEADVGIIYLRTVPGILKIIETILALICFICAMIWDSGWHWSPLAFLKVAALIALIYCAVLVLLRITHVTRGLSLPWNKLDCVCSLFSAIILLIAALLISQYNVGTSLEISEVFAYICCSFLVLDTFYKIIFLLR